MNVFFVFLPLPGVSLWKDSSGVTIGVDLLEVRLDSGLLIRLRGTHPRLKLFLCFGCFCFPLEETSVVEGC